MKVQAHSSSEPPLVSNQDQTFFDESRFVMTFLAIFGIMEILWNFRLVIEGKTGKKIPESSKLESLEKFLPNNSVQLVPHGNKLVLHRNRLNSIC